MKYFKQLLYICFAVLSGLTVMGFILKHYAGSIVNPDPVILITPAPTHVPDPAAFSKINTGNLISAYAFYEVKPNESISLIPNYSEGITSGEIMKQYSCKVLINGGFYSQDNKPIGLFVSGGRPLGQIIQSRTFNGLVWKSGNEYFIDSAVPDSNPDWILQSGPLLIYNGNKLPLKIRDDGPARRSVVIVTGRNEPVFMSFFDENQVNNGPNLADLPDFVREAGKQSGLDIKSAVNLDGGTASVFISGSVNLGELTRSGSFFCIKAKSPN